MTAAPAAQLLPGWKAAQYADFAFSFSRPEFSIFNYGVFCYEMSFIALDGPHEYPDLLY